MSKYIVTERFLVDIPISVEANSEYEARQKANKYASEFGRFYYKEEQFLMAHSALGAMGIKEKTYRLENWSWDGLMLWGDVYGHPRFDDGFPVHTSKVLGVENGLFRTFSGSLYELGKVEVDYEKQFPGAKERLIKSFERKGSKCI